MAYVKRSGGVGADEFDLDFLAASTVRPAVAAPGGGNLFQQALPSAIFQLEVYKTRPGNFNALEYVRRLRNPGDKDFRHGARGLALALCKLHGDVGGKIAMLRIRGGLYDDRRELGGDKKIVTLALFERF